VRPSPKKLAEHKDSKSQEFRIWEKNTRPLESWNPRTLYINYNLFQRYNYLMTKFHIFVIRAILGAVFAVVLTRMFYGRVEVFYVAGLAIILVGLAYFAEYLRNRKNR